MSIADANDDGPGLTQVLFGLKGRLPRFDALYALIAATIVLAVGGLLWTSFVLAFAPELSGMMISPWIGLPLSALGLIQAWLLLAILGKRCHDRDRPIWFLLLLLVPVMQLWPLVDLLFLRGSADLNRFGPVPRGIVRRWRDANREL